MSLLNYAEYKDSGVEWLRKLPSHWSVVPLKRLIEIQNGADHKIVEANEGVPVIGSGGQFAYASTYLHNGESVLLGRKGTIDKPLYVTGKFWTVDTMYWSKILPTACGRFVYYTALTIPFDYYSTNTALPSMTKSALGAHLIARPPLEVQVAIAVFLDRETAKIDALIAEQEKLIALLAEKRKATISHAVTRGLNPDAPMKNSGVAWLRQVPAHWALVRMKRVVSNIEQGWSPQCENYPAAEPNDWGVLKVGCVNGGIFNAMENKKLPDELEPIPTYALKRGDLLVSRANTRELVGSAAVVTCDFDRLLLCDKLYRLRLLDGHCLPEFASAYLGTCEARSQIELDATGASSSMLNIGQSVVLNMLMPLPSVEEQRKIVEFLQSETARFDTLSSDAQHAINLLKERRSALIAAAVTGQIDVRGAVEAPVEQVEAVAA
jgi:type I restriction enzyme, S subunit